jgi:hypothetical protein
MNRDKIVTGKVFDQFMDQLADSANYHNNVMNAYRFKEEARLAKNDAISEGMLAYWRWKKKQKSQKGTS